MKKGDEFDKQGHQDTVGELQTVQASRFSH